jgi:hypothetical protein
MHLLRLLPALARIPCYNAMPLTTSSGQLQALITLSHLHTLT